MSRRRERYPDDHALADRAVITGSVDRIVLRNAALDITLLVDPENSQPNYTLV